ncbi:hypothetical protein LRR81_00175 [Metabacillus sp. GX 13764]|uniref:hypothetical protein n=1 Tax=Metabacillus kandeliae TaxID=2900151 RepID=UPI001E2D4E79|nr:hypothetical protein [Metabacillus kandeliae]MCD7032624.1 hypothetical protein [Metabacillus kandeliae]
MDWKEHFTKDAAIKIQAGREDLSSAIGDYVSQLTDQEVIQLTRSADSEALRNAVALAIYERANQV